MRRLRFMDRYKSYLFVLNNLNNEKNAFILKGIQIKHYLALCFAKTPKCCLALLFSI